MKIIDTELKFCEACLETHLVEIVELEEAMVFKGEEIRFIARYEHCPETELLLESESLLKSNDLAMKNAYRNKVGLLTSQEIAAIRSMYGVSQKDFSQILDWGGATITRYENHQVQDRVHDAVLRKLSKDPGWFIAMLEQAKDRLTAKAYNKYLETAGARFRESENLYRMEMIHAAYAMIKDPLVVGKQKLNLDKVVDMINYIAGQVQTLHKVKLMKLLWYADAYHYKRCGISITGLAYLALPMGAVPELHAEIIQLDGISAEEVIYNGCDFAMRFSQSPDFVARHLSSEEYASIDHVIACLGPMTAQEIVERMHNESAYQKTKPKMFISFSHAVELSI